MSQSDLSKLSDAIARASEDAQKKREATAAERDACIERAADQLAWAMVYSTSQDIHRCAPQVLALALEKADKIWEGK